VLYHVSRRGVHGSIRRGALGPAVCGRRIFQYATRIIVVENL
jgi:hypothetical protein